MMPNLEDKAVTDSYLRSLNNELNGKALYEALSKIETNPKLSEIYRRFAETEGRHASTWIQKLKDSGALAPPRFHLTWRTRLLIFLARRFGTSFVLPSVQALEESDRSNYEREAAPEASKLAADERSHSRLLREVAGTSGGVEGGVLARFEGRHRSTGGNALRAAVLGLGRCHCRGPGDRLGAEHHYGWGARFRNPSSVSARRSELADSCSRWWAKGAERKRSRIAGGLGGFGGSRYPRAPGITVTLDLQKHRHLGGRVEAPAASRE